MSRSGQDEASRGQDFVKTAIGDGMHRQVSVTWPNARTAAFGVSNPVHMAADWARRRQHHQRLSVADSFALYPFQF
jgi:Ser-tRNA(Ala) deacylase AlaX